MKTPRINYSPRWWLAGVVVSFIWRSILSADIVCVDDFSSVPDNTPIANVANWTASSGATGMVTASAGYDGAGKGASINDLSDYKLTLPSSRVLTHWDGPLRFSAKFLMVADNAYAIPQIMIGQTGGVNGFFVRFNGGTTSSSSGTSIQVSSGGTSWGPANFTTLANSNWQRNVWYQVTINNIVLSQTGIGADVHGKLTVTNLDTGTMVVSNQPISGVGTIGGAFNRMDLIQVRGCGGNRAFNVCDLEIGPEFVPHAGIDNFSSVANNTPIANVANWATSAGATGVVTTSAGYGGTGKGANVNDLSDYKLTLPSSRIFTHRDGPLRFSAKFLLVADNAYAIPQIMIGQTGGVNGLCVRFNGGTTSSSSGTSIQVSSGGASWGPANFTTLANSNWQRNVWYQVTINNIVLSQTGTGTDIHGSLTVTNLNTGGGGGEQSTNFGCRHHWGLIQ